MKTLIYGAGPIGRWLALRLRLTAAIAGAAFLMANPITPDRLEVGEPLVPVEVVEILRTSEEVTVEVQGTVTAAQSERAPLRSAGHCRCRSGG